MILELERKPFAASCSLCASVYLCLCNFQQYYWQCARGMHVSTQIHIFLLCVPQLCETLGPDVLTGMLDTSQQVGDELVDGAFVLDGSRDALSHLDLVTFTARTAETLSSLTLKI